MPTAAATLCPGTDFASTNFAMSLYRPAISSHCNVLVLTCGAVVLRCRTVRCHSSGTDVLYGAVWRYAYGAMAAALSS
eukprot:2711438-Rhodomonas_salina.1